MGGEGRLQTARLGYLGGNGFRVEWASSSTGLKRFDHLGTDVMIEVW